MSDVFGNYSMPQLPWQAPSNMQIQSNWMPEAAQNQNVVNNLFSSGGGFGQQTNYYSGLGASYSAAGMSPYGVFSDTGSSGGASPYQTSPNVWNTGATPFQGGSGFDGGLSGGWGGTSASPYQTLSNVFSSGASPFNYGGAGLDWSSLYQPSQQQQSPFSAGDFGAGNFGAGDFGTGQVGTGQVNWSNLFGGGGAQQPQQQPSQQPDFNSLFASRAGGLEATSQPQQKAQEQPAFDFQGGNAGWGSAPTLPNAQALVGYDPSKGFAAGGTPAPDRGVDPAYWADAMGGGDPPPAGSRTYDFAPMFDNKGGFGTGGGDVSGTEAARSGSLGGDAFSYTPPDAANRPAQSLADEARARLAGLIGSPETAKATEEPPAGEAGRAGMVGRAAAEPPVAGPDTADTAMADARAKLAELMGKNDAPIELKVDPAATPAEPAIDWSTGVPLPQARPAGADESPATQVYPGADAPRPPEDIPSAGVSLKGVNPRLVAAVQGGATFLPPGYRVEATSGVRETSMNAAGQLVKGGYHRSGNAVDFKIIGPDGAIPNKGGDETGMYTQLARGVKTWTAQNDPELMGQLGYGGAFGTRTGGGGVPDLMHYDLGGSRGNMVPDVQFGNLKPLTAAERNAMPAYIPLLGDNQVPLDNTAQRAAAPPAPTGPATDSYPGADAPRPPADIPAAPEAVPLPTPRPNAEANLAQAHSLLDTNVMDLVRKNSPGSASMVPSSIAAQTLREAMGNTFTGGMIRSNMTPENLAKGGITQADFDKAYAQGRQAPPRFGGDFGGATDSGGPSPGAFTPFEGFRQSSDFEDRSAEQLGRDQLAQLQARGTSYEPGPEVASTPLGSALGLGDLQGPAPGRASLNFSGFSPSPEPRQGGVGPEMDAPTPEFMRTIAEAESSSNPNKQDKGSQYSGLFQLNQPEFRQYGGTGSIYDADQNAFAATAKMMKEGQQAQDILGRELSPVEQYMVHQQGLAGTISHLQNPDQPAWQSFQQAASSSESRAKQAIWGNLDNAQKAQFGNNVNNITSRDFINLWANKYLEKQVESGQPMTFKGGFSASP